MCDLDSVPATKHAVGVSGVEIRVNFRSGKGQGTSCHVMCCYVKSSHLHPILNLPIATVARRVVIHNNGLAILSVCVCVLFICSVIIEDTQVEVWYQ